MEAYGFTEDFLTFLYSNLKGWKQSVNINNVHSMFQILLSGVPQGSILGSLLCNIFINNETYDLMIINDLFYFIKDAQLLNLAGDITIATFLNSFNDLPRQPRSCKSLLPCQKQWAFMTLLLSFLEIIGTCRGTRLSQGGLQGDTLFTIFL